MAQAIGHFVAGEAGTHPPPAARLWSPIPPGVARAYVEACTAPGEAVLLPYCQGAAEVRDVLAAGRRALAASYDPLVILTAGASLWPPAPRDLAAAIARLGDTPKHGVPMRRALSDLYATPCPSCGRSAVADHFVWDRDQGRPVARWVRCVECGYDAQAALDADDEARMKAVPERGVQYLYLLDRVAPAGQEPALRSRLETLLRSYTPRSLYALGEITMRVDALPDGPIRQALRVLLLDCLDACSPLAPVPGTEPRREGWSRPARYLERNAWLAFEEAVLRRRLPSAPPAPELRCALCDPGRPGPRPAPSRPEPSPPPPAAGFFCQAALRDVRQALPAGSVPLVLASPPTLEPAAWPWAALWAGWIMGGAAAEPLLALLKQRSPDIAWYAETMARSLAALAGLLCEGGRIVLVLEGRRPAFAEAISLAAARAGLAIAALHQSGDGCRLELQRRPAEPPAPEPPPVGARPAASPFAELEEGLDRAVRTAAEAAIRARAEPVPWPALQAAVLRALDSGGWLAAADRALVNVPSSLSMLASRTRTALEQPEFARLPASGAGGDLWWLAGADDLGTALADRVEEVAFRILDRKGPQSPGAFAGLVCRELPGDLTPEPELIEACLHAYGTEMPSGDWQLRAEDQAAARTAERASIVGGLSDFGRRLGYRSAPRPPWDVAWYRAGLLQAVFLVRWQALLGELLPFAEGTPGVQPFLVIPGGRSALLSLKLARNPLWQRRVEEGRWRLVKYRHVRDLLAQPDADEYTLRTIVGLDPIVEKETVQLALF